MPAILLSTLNARHSHAAFGLRYLKANLGVLEADAEILEFDISQRPLDIVEAILQRNPRILGLGIYIWNVSLSTEVVALLKRVRPDLIVILGGPEVSFETEEQEIVGRADHVITGEADLMFAEVCANLLGPAPKDWPRVIAAGLPRLEDLRLPYDLYTAEDAAHRVIYVEASRGCPFTCEFCLSSLEVPVRQFPLDRFLGALQGLMDRGVLRFKFVDRTFNLHSPTSTAILRFFLERMRPGLFVHFEMVPDRLPESLREIIARFPAGALQFEVGIQTLNPEVEERIRRRQDHSRMEDNLRWLRRESGVHLHVDLIAGLPGESLESLAMGFDRTMALAPQEIQVGILKRLRGTPIVRHDRECGMVYSPIPPYEVLRTHQLGFEVLARVRRFARFWDLFGNSGLFPESRSLIWSRSGSPATPFQGFLRFSDWLHDQGVETHGVSPLRRFELLWRFLTRELGGEPQEVLPVLRRDFSVSCRHEMPAWLRDGVEPSNRGKRGVVDVGLPRRQRRHAPGPAGPPPESDHFPP
ncbi:MAG: DUF4080 domain-containing protein [Verrucomicrobiales bacterium]|nr:DUF4080 domain-containing protein [Verrucomicrobiales bacterium]